MRQENGMNNAKRSEENVNWQVLYREMDRRELDVFVAAGPESIFYLTGSYIDCNLMFFDRLAFAVVPRNGESTFIVCNIEEAVVRTVSWVDDVQTYAHYIESAGKLVDVLNERGLSAGRIGVEGKFLNARLYDRIRERLPNVTFVEADEVVERARARKMPAEVKMLQDVARLSDEAAYAACRESRAGVTEYDLAIAMTQEMLARGAHRVEHINLGSGPNTHVSRPKPSGKRLEPAELLLVDFGVVKNMYGSGSGYWADLCRMGVVGKPSARQRDQYALLRDVQRALIEKMNPGVRCNELYTFARDKYLEAGVDEVLPEIGRSMPRARGHEPPTLDAFDTTTLEPNMVFAVGPSFRSGTERYLIRDLVQVTDSQANILSDRWDTKELFVLP
jgi:Xaa-Pro aminopeptidase